MKLIIEGTLPSLNEMINASKSNKYKYVQMKDRAIRMVAWSAVKQLGKIKIAKADYTITWYCPNKRRDKDNVIAGQKFIFDGLQEAGIISNDGWSQIGKITHDFGVDKDNPRIEVLIA
ncbi:Holliday junction DNA helicase [Paenibacillus harenae]|uniref:Holliday junction DNA helicase n=1 Tax=Paenibacillus harenae TaxID=306543 RepID=UPI00040A704B|nr:Holliday junction DNA helicase [Paenibacillus harenae]